MGRRHGGPGATRSGATALAIAPGMLALLLAACGGGGEGDGAMAAVERGRTVYKNVCIACHNADPTRDGSIGPAVAGSSRELLQAKVIDGTYPPGYQPKRGGSAAMPKFPYLADAIPDLAAYLAEAAEADTERKAGG